VGDNKKVANNVVALSSAAVLAIYGAGYARTRAAADRFTQQAAERRPHIPAARQADQGAREGNPQEGNQGVALDVAAPPPAPAPPPAVEARVDDPPVESVSAKPKAAAPSAPAPDIAATRPAVPKTEALVDAAPLPTAAASPATPVDDEPAAPEPVAASVPVPPTVPPLAAPADPAKGAYKDGTFYGWGTSRHGDIQAAVVIESGRITVARVERCLTRYSCSWITPIPPRILTKQATTYDYVSGATESSDAFQDAVAEALSQAK
jgi:uncharacterized protein with FMN-binding domain